VAFRFHVELAGLPRDGGAGPEGEEVLLELGVDRVVDDSQDHLVVVARRLVVQVDSIVNTTDRNVAFFNEPGYEGDSFCVRPGEYVRRLYLYGDGSGTNDWWSNSISSHKFVAAKDCDRWFGWLVE
jgi:hypothetical protein